jgi:hypothetical protein
MNDVNSFADALVRSGRIAPHQREFARRIIDWFVLDVAITVTEGKSANFPELGKFMPAARACGFSEGCIFIPSKTAIFNLE